MITPQEHRDTTDHLYTQIADLRDQIPDSQIRALTCAVAAYEAAGMGHRITGWIHLHKISKMLAQCGCPYHAATVRQLKCAVELMITDERNA